VPDAQIGGELGLERGYLWPEHVPAALDDLVDALLHGFTQRRQRSFGVEKGDGHVGEETLIAASMTRRGSLR
jgi:hypothetical protein